MWKLACVLVLAGAVSAQTTGSARNTLLLDQVFGERDRRG
jgi:hypothetical protein